MRKLVRDNIPEIIRADGKTNFREYRADDAEYASALRAKLHEELHEYSADDTPEELADLLEVIHALADHCYGGFSVIEQLRQKKALARGGFSKKIIVEIID